MSLIKQLADCCAKHLKMGMRDDTTVAIPFGTYRQLFGDGGQTDIPDDRPVTIPFGDYRAAIDGNKPKAKTKADRLSEKTENE